MYFQKPDGWALQARMAHDVQAAQARRKERPTAPVTGVEVNVMYFTNGQWWPSRGLQPKPVYNPFKGQRLPQRQPRR